MTSVDDRPPTTAPARRRRRWPWAAGLGAAVVVAVVLVVFQPQRLFLDDVVDEDLPGLVRTGATSGSEAATDDTNSDANSDTTDAGQEPASAAEPEATVPITEPADPLGAAAAEAAALGAPVAIAEGAFTSVDHPTSGTALLVVQPDGSRLLRIEALDTDNGPDLRVVLSTGEVGTGEYDDLVELGGLKGNIGDQNYDIPAGLDLSTIRSVVIWCDRFSVAFGEAPLALT